MIDKTSKNSGNKEMWGCIGTVTAALITGIITLIVAGKFPFFSTPPTPTPTITQTSTASQFPIDILTSSPSSTSSPLTNNIQTLPPPEPTLFVNSTTSMIAFVRYFDGFSGTSVIYRINSDGTNEIALTGSNYRSRDPSWSPDGKWIAFSSDKDGDYEIYIMDANGNNWYQLTYNNIDDRGPSWSPDGKWIAYYSPHDDKQQSEIFLIRPDRSGLSQLTFNNTYDRYPSWSPNSLQLVFNSTLDSQKWQIRLMNIDGSGQQVIIADSLDNWWPRWSHDGLKLAYVKGNYSGVAYIYIRDLVNGADTKLVYDNSAGQDWSYDGSQIVFSCWSQTQPKLWIINTNGTNPRQLTFGSTYDTQPVWYP